MNGKGDAPRPMRVSKKEYDNNYEQINWRKSMKNRTCNGCGKTMTEDAAGAAGWLEIEAPQGPMDACSPRCLEKLGQILSKNALEGKSGLDKDKLING